jgi:23S rRNA pseudouridine1911/1915/1917 synthase
LKTSKARWIVSSDEQGVRLDRFLATADRLGSRGRVRSALDRGQVFVNDIEASGKDAATPLTASDVVHLWLDRPGSSRLRRFAASARQARKMRGLQILYEDESLIVVNKPAGLLTVPLGRGPTTALGAGRSSRSVYHLVAEHLGVRRRHALFIVHRIDRDTSGIVVFAKTAAAQQALKDQFARREPDRVYWAVVHGRPHPARGRWRDHLAWDDDAVKQTVTDAKDRRGVEAISDYRVLESFTDAALLEVRLHTGKRNQIRIQAAHRGHPLVGERQYAGGPSERTGPTHPHAGGPSRTTGPTHPRQALHAYRLAFAHPIDGRRLTFEAPLPGDLAKLLERLRRSVRR